MQISMHCHGLKVRNYDQYKMDVLIDLKRDDFKKTLFFLLKNDPTLWDVLEKIRDNLDSLGIE